MLTTPLVTSEESSHTDNTAGATPIVVNMPTSTDGAEIRFTPAGDISRLVAEARVTFDSGRTRALDWRKDQLRAILRMINENKDAITTALQADLQRPELECVLGETLTIVGEVKHALAHINEWVKPQPVKTPAVLSPGSSFIKPDPLGVICIIAPWNFPIQLIVNVLIPVIAGGNTAVIKPSELAPHCAILMQQLVTRYLDTTAIKVVQGAVSETTELLRQRFDHILYTGNGSVAKVVMRAAAEHLTPVTLELGGKSPTIVARDADIALAAKRIISAKCLNAGQVCLAPDYILVERAVADRLVDALISTIRQFYGDDMQASTSFGRIINHRHFQRVSGLLEGAGGRVVFGGDSNPKTNYMGLTLIRDPALDSALMQDEIFGPLLPIITVENMDEAIRFITAKPKSLGLYVFTGSSSTYKRVLEETSSGGAVINDCMMHALVCDLPFGGVGASGIGAYHGKFGFDTFTHKKAVFHQATAVDMGFMRYPPYTHAQVNRLEWMFRNLPDFPSVKLIYVFILCLIAAVIVLAIKLSDECK